VKQKVSPQEQRLLQVPRSDLDEDIALIQTLVPLVLAELIYNLNETGLSDWEEPRDKIVLIPAQVGGPVLHYPVDRSFRHQTLLDCASASGDL
jgi:hypothetical protein